MKYSAKPTPKPADPKRSPQRAALELAKQKAKKAGSNLVPEKSKGKKDPYFMYRNADGKMEFNGKD
jgi:hypothetical protein